MKLIRSNEVWLTFPKLDGASQRRAYIYRQKLYENAVNNWGEGGKEAATRLINMPFTLTTDFWLSGGTKESSEARKYLMNELPVMRFFRSAERYPLAHDSLMSYYREAVKNHDPGDMSKLSMDDFRALLLSNTPIPDHGRGQQVWSEAVLFRWVVKTM